MDDVRVVPRELVDELGYWHDDTPVNGPYPRFRAGRVTEIADWLLQRGFTVRRLPDEDSRTPSVSVQPAKPVAVPSTSSAEPAKLPRPRKLEELTLQWQRILEIADELEPTFGYLDTLQSVPLTQSGTQVTVQMGTRFVAAAVREWTGALETAMARLYGYSWIVAVSCEDADCDR